MFRTLTNRLRDIYNDGGMQAVCFSIGRFIKWRIRNILRRILYATGSPLLILRAYVRLRRAISPKKYTDADPFKIIYVDPTSVQRDSEHDLPRKWGEVKSGNWDLTNEKFNERLVFRSIEQRFVEGREWTETDYFEYFCNRMNDGGEWGFNSEAEFQDRCEEIDDLYAKISSEGYRSQRELFCDDPEDVTRANNDAVHSLLNEVCVDIGRDGELLYRHGGQHRLSIAKILDIEEIPVLVVTRHEVWQETRNELRDSVASTTDCSHPDLQDVSS